MEISKGPQVTTNKDEGLAELLFINGYSYLDFPIFASSLSGKKIEKGIYQIGTNDTSNLDKLGYLFFIWYIQNRTYTKKSWIL